MSALQALVDRVKNKKKRPTLKARATARAQAKVAERVAIDALVAAQQSGG
jgi:hypothetical protein